MGNSQNCPSFGVVFKFCPSYLKCLNFALRLTPIGSRFEPTRSQNFKKNSQGKFKFRYAGPGIHLWRKYQSYAGPSILMPYGQTWHKYAGSGITLIIPSQVYAGSGIKVCPLKVCPHRHKLVKDLPNLCRWGHTYALWANFALKHIYVFFQAYKPKLHGKVLCCNQMSIPDTNSHFAWQYKVVSNCW